MIQQMSEERLWGQIVWETVLGIADGRIGLATRTLGERTPDLAESADTLVEHTLEPAESLQPTRERR